MKNEKWQTMFNLVSGILAMAVNLGIQFFLSGYIVENLGEEANGFTQLANNFVSYATLITLAFNSMASRFMAIQYHQGKKEKVKVYYSSVLICNFLLCVGLIPIAIGIVRNLERLIVIEQANLLDVKILFGCVFLNFFASLLVSVASMSMFVTNTVYYQNLIQLLRYVLNGILLLCAFSFCPPKIYYVSFIAMILTVASYPVFRVIQSKLMPELKFCIRDFKGYAVQEMFASGIWNTVNQCGHMLMTGLDLLLANLFISPASMGLLSVAKTIPNAIINLAGILNTNFAPAVTINWARGEKDVTLRQLRSSMKISSVLVSISIMTFISYGVQFYSLWMPTLDAKKLTILSFLTCMAFIPWAGTQALYNVFTAAKRLKVNSIAFTVTGVINVAVVYGCLKYTQMGVFAIAGTSSVLTVIRNLIITAPYIAKLLGLKWYEFYRDVWTSLACCMINLAASFLVKCIYMPHSWISLVFCVFGTCLITFTADLFFILDKDERAKLKEKLKGVKIHG